MHCLASAVLHVVLVFMTFASKAAKPSRLWFNRSVLARVPLFTHNFSKVGDIA